jgi:N6-L-threonylcarbamoyladenine synthase
MNEKKYILAFETSCDDTSVAIVDSNYKVYANTTSSQPIHNDFGGVVPELASRLHIKNITYLLDTTLKQSNLNISNIDAVAVSVNPGLIGSLLVGVSFAKSLAFAINKPLIAINHMIGHVKANKIENPDLEPPYLGLIVSGGHTEIVYFKSNDEIEIIGKTRDDAAGEAFDKIAKLLNLGYPGGPIIDRLAQKGNSNFVKFPQAMNIKNNYDFSFSGLKTSVRNYLNKNTKDFIDKNLANIVASAQKAITEILVKKTIDYAKKNNIKTIIVAGGVSANSSLREKISLESTKINCHVYFPPIKYCMDNAAMIGCAAVEKYLNQDFADLYLNAFSTKGLKIL